MFTFTSYFFPSKSADFAVFLTMEYKNVPISHGHSPILTFPLKI